MKHEEIIEQLNLVSDQHDPDDDKTVMSLKDTRKPTLTLRDLNKLRKMREKNKLNLQTDNASLEIQYAPAAEE